MNTSKITFALMAVMMGMSEAQAQSLKSNTDSVSYALGKDVGSSLTSSGVKINSTSFLQGVNDAINGAQELIGEEEGMRIIKAAFAKAAEEKVNALKQGETAFFDSIKNKSGIQHLPEGLYYEVIEEGSGPKATSGEEVTVHYKGTLADGKVFDSSYERGQPLDIDLGNVIKGWQLGIPLMNSGAKYRFYIPSALGYGERGAGRDIPPYSALIFDIELIGVKSSQQQEETM